MSAYICPECGSRIDVSTKMDYVYCPVCTEKVSADDLKKGNLSRALINALTAKEIDAIITSGTEINVEALTIAAEKGSVNACMELASRYVLKNDCAAARKYFLIASRYNIADAEFGILVCDLEADDRFEDNFKRLMQKIKRIDQSSFRYLSKKTLDELNRIVSFKQNIWDISYSRAKAKATANQSNPKYEPDPTPYYPRYIPPVEESAEEKSWIMGCGICGSYCGTSYN